MVTLKELAEECNVSIATISNILNGKSNVSKETKERVLAVIKERGYRPNLMARSLRAITTRTIGVIVDDLGAFGTPEIIEGIISNCEKSNYKVIIETLRIFTSLNGVRSLNTQEFRDKVDSTLAEMLAMRVNAIIYISAYSRDITYLPKDFPIPIVLAYATTQDEAIPCVIPEDLKALEELTDYLVENNCKKIAVIKGTENIHTKLREEGFRKAMKKHNLPINEDFIFDGRWNAEYGKKACQEIFSHGRPDAIICFNDYMAAGAYQYLVEYNITPGKDISVVGFDNNKISRSLPPPLTTMGIGVYGIGSTAAQLIFRMIAGEKVEYHTYEIPCNFIERESVVKK